MIWEDMFVDRLLSQEEIRSGMSSVFRVAPAEVVVVDDLDELTHALGDQDRILCERIHERGDFVMRISVYIRDASIEKWIETVEHEMLVGQLAEHWGAALLVSDDSVDPFSWVLVRGIGQCYPVSLDAVRYDDADEIVLSSFSQQAARP